MKNLDLAIYGGKPSRDKFIHPQYPLSSEARERVIKLLDEGVHSNFYGGKITQEFEKAFAKFHGVADAVAVNSGTSALHLAVAAADLGPGDEVIIGAACYVSAVSAVLQQNAIPVICDIRRPDLSMAPKDIERCITKKTKAVMAVHFYGYPCDMESILRIAKESNLVVIEDCGQSHGARISGQLVGTFGDFACYSFAPRKHISTGEGGMVIARTTEQGATVRKLANKGKGKGWLDYERIGFSYVMPDFQAILGIEGLKRMDKEIEKRRKAAKVYREVFSPLGVRFLEEQEDAPPVFFKMPLILPDELVSKRAWIIEAIGKENISVRPPHPPVYRIPWLSNKKIYNTFCPYQCPLYDGEVSYDPAQFPITEDMLIRIIEIESGPGLTEEDVMVTANGVAKVLSYARENMEQIPTEDCYWFNK